MSKTQSKARAWQLEAVSAAIKHYESGDKHFAFNAAPGAGKTKAAIMMAEHLFEQNKIDRVIVIAPRKEVVKQWSKEFLQMTGRKMMKITGASAAELDVEEMEENIASTWAGVSGLADVVQAICENYRVLVIADEVHHAAMEAAWGVGADNSMKDSAYVLALTGTPLRSDGQAALWFREENSYTVSYKTAVDEGWCVPATFHRHFGEFEVELHGHSVKVSQDAIRVPSQLVDLVDATAKRALKFDRLIKQPTRTEDGKPMLHSYHSSMLDWANKKLDKLRGRALGEFGMPNAGGLVIAPNIEMAEYFAELIEMKFGEKAAIVHSALGGDAAEMRIKAFRESDRKWMVSVNMVSEGVDIPRLRVLVFLPMASTELYFRQAIGRVIRKQGNPKADNSRAYCIMPETSDFVEFAQRIEGEMGRQDDGDGEKQTRAKKPPEERESWTCNEHDDDGCGAINDAKSRVCHACGMPRRPVYSMSIQDAAGWREGVFSREMELTETDVQRSEVIEGDIQTTVLDLGDPRLMRLASLIPPEAWSLLDDLTARVREKKAKREAAR